MFDYLNTITFNISDFVVPYRYSSLDLYIKHLCSCDGLSFQYSDLANEVLKGRGKVPVADYKVVQYVNDKTEDLSQSSSKRSCYSFCMCPGGQVQLP